MRWLRPAAGLAVSLLLVGPGAALSQPAPAAPATHFLIVSGVSGEKRFADAFHGWAMAIISAATTRFGAPDSLVTYLAEDPARDPKRIGARSTKENVEGAIGKIAARARSGDRVVVILFGHGSAQGTTSRFNVPGPDLTDGDFAKALDGVKEATVVLINTASASGDFVKTVSRKGRVVITATKSSREQNETYFPQFFVDALTSGKGDADKDGRVSLLEAFAYARREVARVFEQGNRIVTEHPLLDDDGDGVGHTDASDKGPDGLRAGALFFEPLGGVTVAADPRAAQLLADRQRLEARIDSLRQQRGTMSEDAYQKALEPLILELAEKTRALRAIPARKP